MNRAAGILLLLIGVALPALATQVEPLSLDETIRQSEAALVGTITARQSRWADDSHRWMLTDFTLTVDEAVYGNVAGKGVTLTYWGGTIGGVTQAISDLRLPEVGEHLLVMLRAGWQSAPGFTPVAGFDQGLFHIDDQGTVLDAAGQGLLLTAAGQVARRGTNLGTIGSLVDEPTFT